MIAGISAVFTAIKPGKFSISFNSYHMQRTDDKFKNLMSLPGRKIKVMPSSFLIRHIMENANSYDEAVDMVKKIDVMTDAIITVCGVEQNEGIIIYKKGLDSEQVENMKNNEDEQLRKSFTNTFESFSEVNDSPFDIVLNKTIRFDMMNRVIYSDNQELIETEDISIVVNKKVLQDENQNSNKSYLVAAELSSTNPFIYVENTYYIHKLTFGDTPCQLFKI